MIPVDSPPKAHRLPRSDALRAIWRREDSYRHLLIALAVLIVAYPVITLWPGGRLIEQLVLVGVLITGTLATYQHRAQVLFTILMTILMVATGIANHLEGDDVHWLVVANLLCTAGFLGHVTFALAGDIFSSRERPSTGLLYGAVSVYLLIGTTFACVVYLLETLIPGSYHCGSSQCDGVPRMAAYVYFSFITLSTVGYGEILPATRIAGMLAYVEAIVGQMYLAILVGRLIGMHLSQPRT
jgi:hypothetical protein